jgi:hypothetical protein
VGSLIRSHRTHAHTHLGRASSSRKRALDELLRRLRRARGGRKGGSAPSTGFLALMAALSVCEHVTVYGFSREASRDAKSSSFSYHYFKVRWCDDGIRHVRVGCSLGMRLVRRRGERKQAD